MKTEMMTWTRRVGLRMGLLLTAFCCGWVACSEDDDDRDAIVNRLQIVSIPDFFFRSNEVTLGSTFDSRAEPSELTLQIDEQLVVKDDVSVRLEVADDDDEFRALKKWGKGEFRAAKLSIGINTPTDVMVFMPVSSQHFCYNSQESLGIVAEQVKEMEMTLPKTTIASQLKTRYGDVSMTCMIGELKVVATASYGKREDGVEGIEVLITGVTSRMISYLRSTFQGGLTVEVWCYFKNTLTRADLRDVFNRGANVTFSKKPPMYGNVFTYVRNYPYKTYAKEDETTGMMIPYKDADFEEKLESKYWVRPADENGNPSKDYLLMCHKNEWDCKVAYRECEYAKVFRNNADIPEDVETKFYILPNNYNVYYFDEYELMTQ